MLKLLRSSGHAGFTLLETMIALAIMMVAFTAILAVESNALSASTRAKQLNVVAMLARNRMIDLEYEFEGKKFDEFKKESTGTFAQPYQDYQWKAEVKEIKFPNLSFGGGGKSEGGSGESDGGGAIADLLTKLITQFLSKAVREVTVTILWKKGTGEQQFSVSTYWVDLNHEFQLTE